jgi:hypothetical protein
MRPVFCPDVATRGTGFLAVLRRGNLEGTGSGKSRRRDFNPLMPDEPWTRGHQVDVCTDQDDNSSAPIRAFRRLKRSSPFVVLTGRYSRMRGILDRCKTRCSGCQNDRT